MFCKWDKDLSLKVVKQPKGCNTFELNKKTPYAIQRTYNGKVVGYIGCFSSRTLAETFLLEYAKNG